MTTQTHKVATDALETLGTFPIPDNSGRDAIHLAVEPAVAGIPLRAGERVKFEDGKAILADDDATGIVDPFITGMVRPGERFWFVVLPRTITSLRHVWSHPLFPEEGAAAYHADADEHYVAASPAEQWLRDYAKQIDENFDDLMEAADGWVRSGEYFYGAPQGTPGDVYFGKFEGESTHRDFWPNYEAYRQTEVPKDKQRSFFTCSC